MPETMTPRDPAAAPAPGRTRRNRGSELVRDRLIESAITEFAAHGFAGASTRAIAEGADAHQSQIKYHFESKDELWRRCLERLIDEVDRTVADQQADIDPLDVRGQVEAAIRGLVSFAARRPELNRIMMHEATSAGDRLAWSVETLTGARQVALEEMWRDLIDIGLAAPIDPDLLYHTLIGAASLIYANAPEARLMGIDPADADLVRRHGDSLIAMFLTPDH